jgi:hypothetical protein
MVKIFEIENGVLVPTEHCYSLKTLKNIMDRYPDDYMKAYLYIFYMSCFNPDLNPFFEVPEYDKESIILEQIGDVSFSTEDEEIIEGLKFVYSLYETPSLKAYLGIKGALDRINDYMSNTAITDGRDGNITAIVNTAAKFENIRLSFKGAYKDLMEEQKSQVRGGQNVSYDTPM